MSKINRNKLFALTIAAVSAVTLALWQVRPEAFPVTLRLDLKTDQKYADQDAISSSARNPIEVKSGVAITPAIPSTEDDVDTIPIPELYALRSGMKVPRASRWQDLIAGLSPEQRAIAEAMAARYPEAYRFVSPEQLRWMVENGYPMPEEIVEAELMSMDDLLALGETGNLKAMMLAYDRYLREFTSTPRQGITNDAIRVYELNHRLRESCSPFPSYIASRVGEVFYPEDPGVAAIAHLSVAQAFGDWRVDPTIAEMIRSMGMPSYTVTALTVVNLAYIDHLRDKCSQSWLPTE